MQRGYDLRLYLEILCLFKWLIRFLCLQADRELASNGKSPEKLKGAGSFLMKVFGVLAVCFLQRTFFLADMFIFSAMINSDF